MSEIRLLVTENVLRDPNKVTLQMYHDYLERDGRAWVAEIDHKLIGFSYAAHHDNSIWALFVDPEYEGLGAGKACDYLFACGASAFAYPRRSTPAPTAFTKRKAGRDFIVQENKKQFVFKRDN